MQNPQESSKIEVPKEETAFHWPISYMKKETFKKGDTLFKKGDKADKMFYITKGSLRLVEINKVIGENEVIGEMGIFAPSRERMASAICQEDLESYTMSKDDVITLFRQDSSLALNLLELSLKRYSENLKAETQARERIESELRIAREIQSSMVPTTFPAFPERRDFDVYALMDPAKEVGGDLYDFFLIDKNKLCLVIGDVSGKGVPAALFMAISKTLTKTEALLGLSADQLVTQVNRIICMDNRACMFVTLFCMLVNLETGEVEFSSGGHNPPLICGDNRCFEFISVPKGCVVGAMENSRFESKKIMLKPNDVVFLYTDGVTEAMNPENQLFSEGRLKVTLEGLIEKHRDVKDIIHGMRDEIKNYAQGAVQSDDITMLAFKYFGKGA